MSEAQALLFDEHALDLRCGFLELDETDNCSILGAREVLPDPNGDTFDLMKAQDLSDAALATRLNAPSFSRCSSYTGADFTRVKSLTPESEASSTGTVVADAVVPPPPAAPRTAGHKKSRSKTAARQPRPKPQQEKKTAPTAAITPAGASDMQHMASAAMMFPYFWAQAQHGGKGHCGMGPPLAMQHLYPHHLLEQSLAYATFYGQCHVPPIYHHRNQSLGCSPMYRPPGHVGYPQGEQAAVVPKQEQGEASCERKPSLQRGTHQAGRLHVKRRSPEDSEKHEREMTSQRKSARRKHDKDLLQRLDDMLPAVARSQQRKSAGCRALGTSGRSQITVLHDVVRYMKLMFPAGAPGSALAAAASTGTPLKSLDYQPMTAAHGGAGRVQPAVEVRDEEESTRQGAAMEAAAAAAAGASIEDGISTQGLDATALTQSTCVASAIIDLPSWTIRNPSVGMTNLLLARLAASEAEAVAGSGEQQGASAADAAAPPGAYTAACPTPARAGLRKRRRGEGAASTATSAGLVGYFGEVGGEERGTGVAVQDVDGEGKDKDTAQVAGRRRCRDVAGRSLRDFVAPADLCRLVAFERNLLWNGDALVDKRLSLRLGPPRPAGLGAADGLAIKQEEHDASEASAAAHLPPPHGDEVAFQVGWLSALSTVAPPAGEDSIRSYRRILLVADVASTPLV